MTEMKARGFGGLPCAMGGNSKEVGDKSYNENRKIVDAAEIGPP